MKSHTVSFLHALVVGMTLLPAASFAGISTWGFSGLEDVVLGTTNPKGAAAYQLAATHHTRYFDVFNYRLEDGGEFILGPEVTTTDLTFSAVFPLNPRIELGLSINQRFISIENETPTAFLDREITEEGVSDLTFGVKGNVLKMDAQGIHWSVFALGHFPLGDEFKGLTYGRAEFDLGTAFTYRFVNGLGLTGNLGYMMRDKPTRYPFDGDEQHNGSGYGRFLMDWLVLDNLQLTLGYSNSEQVLADFYLQSKNLTRASAGMKYYFRHAKKDSGQTQSAKYFVALGARVFYAFDENSEDSPVGGMLSLSMESNSKANTKNFVASRSTESEPGSVVLTSRNDESGTAVTALTTGVGPNVTYHWSVNDRHTTTDSPELKVSEEERGGTIVCRVIGQNGEIARDSLRF